MFSSEVCAQLKCSHDIFEFPPPDKTIRISPEEPLPAIDEKIFEYPVSFAKQITPELAGGFNS